MFILYLFLFTYFILFLYFYKKTNFFVTYTKNLITTNIKQKVSLFTPYFIHKFVFILNLQSIKTNK